MNYREMLHAIDSLKACRLLRHGYLLGRLARDFPS